MSLLLVCEHGMFLYFMKIGWHLLCSKVAYYTVWHHSNFVQDYYLVTTILVRFSRFGYATVQAIMLLMLIFADTWHSSIP